MDALTQLDKIQILLHEYDGLRSEIVQRWVGTQQQISIGVLVLMGVITVLVSTKAEYPRASILYVLLAIAIGIFGYAMWQVRRDTCKAATRVSEIEQDVNQRAGEELLQWETRWGGCVTGFWGSARPFKKLSDHPHSN
jgi:hypothetical protein